MLCQFSFQNFKSYKDETTFDFRAMAIPEFQDALIRQEKAEDLLPVSAIYGPNGGGKTNLLQAFFCLINLVVKPIHALEKNRQPMIFQQGSSVAPFMLDESSANEPTIFQVFFRVGEKEYQYYISLKEEIVFESLLWRTLGGKKTGLIFERDGQKIELGASISKASINLDVNPKMPYLSFLASDAAWHPVRPQPLCGLPAMLPSEPARLQSFSWFHPTLLQREARRPCR